MTTVYSAWQGSSPNARIKLVYTVSYTADHTQAIFDGTFYIEFDGPITDANNTWKLTGDLPDKSGSDLNISFGSGGGTKKIADFAAFQKYGDATITGYVDGLEGPGGSRIDGTFTLDSGALAPYFTSTAYVASAITPSSFAVTNLLVAANGGTMNNVQVEYNTTPSDTGASYKTQNAWATPTVTGLQHARQYYYRVRIANSTYGWSAWGPWKTVVTATEPPGQPDPGWYFSEVDMDSFTIGGNSVPDTGGNRITDWEICYNTSPVLLGSTFKKFSLYYDNLGYPTFVPQTSGLRPLQIDGLLPGTKYYVTIRAWSNDGAGFFSSPWKEVTTLQGIEVNVGGVWKTATPFVNVGGFWFPAIRYVKVNSNWEQ